MLRLPCFSTAGIRASSVAVSGFRTDGILLMSFDPGLARYDASQTEDFYRLLTERSKNVPGVQSVALTSTLPLDQISLENTPVAPEGFQLPIGTAHGQRLLVPGGRRVLRHDANTNPPADGPFSRPTLLMLRASPSSTRHFAARYWPGQDVIGERFQLKAPDQTWVEVVGLAAQTKVRTLQEGATAFVYYPRRQRPAPQTTLLVEAEGDPVALAGLLREAVRSIDRNMPILEVRSMSAFYEASAVTFSLLIVRIVGAMGATGLVLGADRAICAHGVFGEQTNPRDRDSDGGWRKPRIRLAEWCSVTVSGLRSAAGPVGVVASSVTRDLLRVAFPFPSMPATDLTIYVVVVPALLAVTLLAALVPALRAARVDPLVALRQD